MRVLHILDHSIPLHSGYSFRTLYILQHQRALEWETYHLTGPKQEACTAVEEMVDGWHFYRTPSPSGLLTGVPGLGEIEMMGELTHRLEQVVRRINPHILHAHSPALNAIPAMRVGRRVGIPVVYEVRAFWEDAAVAAGITSERGIRYRLTRGLDTYALKRVDAVTTICEGLRGDIVARGVPAQKVTVVPNAVDADKFAPDTQSDGELKSALGLNDGVVLGFIGSFYAYEGLSVLLHALRRIHAQAPQTRVLLVGGGPEETNLKKLASDLDISDKVIVVGRVAHDDVRRYYRLIDVLVYPRLRTRLTELVTPLKPLEAMSEARLVAASDVGGHRELIRDGETGVLFKPGNVEDLAVKLVDLIYHPERWAGIQSRARSHVETERNWTTSVARYRDVYDRLVASRTRRH